MQRGSQVDVFLLMGDEFRRYGELRRILLQVWCYMNGVQLLCCADASIHKVLIGALKEQNCARK